MKTVKNIGKKGLAIMRVLRHAKRPLSAYEIMAKTRQDGIRAPTTAYRELAKLINEHKVHRLESVNAFVACSHQACQDHHAAIFSICQKCGQHSEFIDRRVDELVDESSRTEKFQVASATLELSGYCVNCREA